MPLVLISVYGNVAVDVSRPIIESKTERNVKLLRSFSKNVPEVWFWFTKYNIPSFLITSSAKYAVFGNHCFTFKKPTSFVDITCWYSPPKFL